MNTQRFAATILLQLCAVVAWAEPRELMVFYPGAPGTAEDAAEVMGQFGAALAKNAGWAATDLKVTYENDLQAGLDTIAKKKPAFLLTSLPVYLAQGKALKMKLVAQTLPAPKGNKTEGYYIMGRKDAPVDLAGAKGLKLVSNLLFNKDFVSRVILGGRDVETFFKTKEVSSGLRAIKQVAGEEKKADLVLLDQHQYESLVGMPEFQLLKLVHRSPDVPTTPMVTLEGVAADADVAAFKKGLLSIGKDPSAKDLLDTMTLKGFGEPDAATFESAQKLYER